MSGLVHNIAYIRLPTAEAYGMYSYPQLLEVSLDIVLLINEFYICTAADPFWNSAFYILTTFCQYKMLETWLVFYFYDSEQFGFEEQIMHLPNLSFEIA